MTALSAVLRSARRWRGKTLAATAADAGISMVYANKLERGERTCVNPVVLEGLATSLGLPADLLLALAGVIPPDIAEALGGLSAQAIVNAMACLRAATEGVAA